MGTQGGVAAVLVGLGLLPGQRERAFALGQARQPCGLQGRVVAMEQGGRRHERRGDQGLGRQGLARLLQHQRRLQQGAVAAAQGLRQAQPRPTHGRHLAPAGLVETGRLAAPFTHSAAIAILGKIIGCGVAQHIVFSIEIVQTRVEIYHAMSPIKISEFVLWFLFSRIQIYLFQWMDIPPSAPTICPVT